ncbi:chitinase-3-like protein 1 [Amphibalanus amphitrite]|uniref:chitinase-3-like protein 1 n=1 Tax=Amphibalanus amphitrite TaxID=1232801 RepID=UPI001C9164CE|nr:chitinase-3-like protein 1 [Amphibalanus amphitrite]
MVGLRRTMLALAVTQLALTAAEVRQQSDEAGPELICYYGSWARLREGDGRVTIDQLDPSLCTTLVFAFARLDDRHWTLLHSLPDRLLFYRQLTGLRRRHPQLRVELAVGGWNDSHSADYATMAASGAGRAAFAASAAAALEMYGFDGLHLDWEFPTGQRQRRDFTALLAELRAALEPHRYRLSVAVPAGPYQARTSFEMGAVARLADRLLLMAYDLHGGWTPTAADHHAPLRPRSTDFSGLDAETAVRLWRSAGASARQIVLGVPLYGRGWVVEEVGPPPLEAKGVAPPGPLTKERGVLSYLEICSKVQQRGWTSQQLLDEGRPFGSAAVGDGQWFGYDDEHMVREKARLATELGLGGVFVWDIAQDDVRGLCSPRPFTLTSIIKETLSNLTERAVPEERAPSVPLASNSLTETN